MIGIFDPGFGGLHVLRGITKHIPRYGYIYLGDSARAPYGSRSPDEIYRFTKQGVDFLFAHGANLVVLACNTASSEALRKIQMEYGEKKFAHSEQISSQKVLGVLIPFAEAAARTKNKRVGVLATEGTVRSGSFPREITKVDPMIEVFQRACPLLVPMIEAGEQNSAALVALITEYVAPLLANDIDTLVLECTHYGIVEEKIRAEVGPTISIVSERDVLPQRLAEYLNRHPEIESQIGKNIPPRFYSTGDIARFDRIGSIFFESEIHAQHAKIGLWWRGHFRFAYRHDMIPSMNTSVHSKTKTRGSSLVIPQLDPKARLAALRGIFGMWKKRTPHPIREQNKIRKEWDRTLPRR